MNRKVRARMIRIAKKIQHKLQQLRGRRSTDTVAKKKKKRALHTGFAFSQEPGNAPHVVDKVRSQSLTGRKSMLFDNKFSTLVNENSNDYPYLSKTHYKSSKDDGYLKSNKNMSVISEENSKE